MGLLADGTELAPRLTPAEFSGPGVARRGYSEFNQRELLTRWADDLEMPGAKSPGPPGHDPASQPTVASGVQA